MKLSVFNPVLHSMSLEDSLKYLQSLGVQSMELGCGGYPGTKHADVTELSKSPAKVKELKARFDKYGIGISALSVHGNGITPDKEFAKKCTDDFTAACKVANDLGADRVVTFSGCPGDGTSKNPNWVTCAWPAEYSKILEYQWNDVLIPYWQKMAKTAADNGVKIALEMHPGFCVYNPSTMLRLRQATSDAVGANFDPSHLLWQGIDIVAAIKAMGPAIHFFHAKDTMFNEDVKAVEGVLDSKSYGNEIARSWIFRTVGYGGCDWKGIITALRLIGYDHTISIEHEDSLMTPKEGLEKAIAYLKEVMIFDASKTEMWW